MNWEQIFYWVAIIFSVVVLLWLLRFALTTENGEWLLDEDEEKMKGQGTDRETV